MATTAAKTETNVASTEPKTETNVASTEPKTETNVASTEPKTETNVASTVPKTETNVASTEPKTETNVASTEPKTETNVASTEPKTESNVASTVPKTETNVASTEPKTETNVASTEPKTETNVASTKPKTETNVGPTSTPSSTVNDSEVPVTGTEINVLPSNAPKSTDNAPEVPVGSTEPKTELDVPPTSTPKSTVTTPEIKTVEVSNISLGVTEKDIWEFFSFSGNIQYIEMKSESETTKNAFVTFKESQGANTAVLLTGATIGDLSVSVSHVENYQLPAGAPPLTSSESPTNADRKREVAQKAEEVVSTMLAKGYVLGKDALQKAKSFDEKHQFTSNASAKVASLDRKMGLTQKMKQVNARYQVTEATKSALSTGVVWVSGAFAAIAKAAEGVGSKTKEKVEKAEGGKEGSKTKEKVEKNEEEKKGSKTKEKVQDAEGSNTKEKVDETDKEKEVSRTNEKVPEAEEKKTDTVNDNDESLKKDSPLTPVKSSNDNNNLPNQ